MTSNKNCLFFLIYRWHWVEFGRSSLGLAGLISIWSHVSPVCLLISLDQQALWACSSHWVTEVQEGKSCCTSTFQAHAHAMSDKIPLVKAIDVDQPQVKGQSSTFCPPWSQSKSDSQAQDSGVGIILPSWKRRGEKGVKSSNSKLICHNVIEASSCS